MKISALVFALTVPLITSMFLSGCTPKTENLAFAENFQGYPCNGHCDQFRSGFETAETQQYTRNTDCQTMSESTKLGCLSYIHEYQVENNPNGAYVFP